nr:uncharacterized protein LOC109227352 [Ipomoea batatas]
MTENKLIKIRALLIIIFSFPSSSLTPLPPEESLLDQNWIPLIQQGRAFFFFSPPNLDFRQGTEDEAPKAMEEEQGEDTSAYWTKLDSLIQKGRAFFFSPPNLDFRQGTEEAPKAMEEGTGEKVKEAVVKSVDKSKATVEDSAKSAAKLAGETVGKATQKLKETLSTEYQDPLAKPDEL